MKWLTITRWILFALVVLLPGCASTSRHQLIAADYAFATAVNAVDDAVFNACQTHTIAAETCNRRDVGCHRRGVQQAHRTVERDHILAVSIAASAV
jgi:hypothetical protein